MDMDWIAMFGTSCLKSELEAYSSRVHSSVSNECNLIFTGVNNGTLIYHVSQGEPI